MLPVRIFKSSRQDLTREKSFIPWVHHLVSVVETQMAAHLVMVTLMMMSPFLSTPAWTVDLSLAEYVHLLQALQVLHLPIHSIGVVSFDVRMIDVSSRNSSSLATHKWYNY